jgi:hypothetical protein
LLEPKTLSRERRASIPPLLARMAAIARDLGIKELELPLAYVKEAEAQFSGVSASLEVEQIRELGRLGLATEHRKLAWAASVEGLRRGGPTEAFFLLLRARAAPRGFEARSLALTAAAAELGRFHRDSETVDEAVEILRNPFGGDSAILTLEKAREVVRRELASPAFPAGFKQGPDYRDLLPVKLCQCADCRRERGEIPDDYDYNSAEDPDDDYEFTEDEMRRMFNESLPKDVPPDTAKLLFEVMKETFETGASPDEVMARVFGDGRKGGGKKKGRNR